MQLKTMLQLHLHHHHITVFKTKHKLYICPGVSPPSEKFWVHACIRVGVGHFLQALPLKSYCPAFATCPQAFPKLHCPALLICHPIFGSGSNHQFYPQTRSQEWINGSTVFWVSFLALQRQLPLSLTEDLHHSQNHNMVLPHNENTVHLWNVINIPPQAASYFHVKNVSSIYFILTFTFSYCVLSYILIILTVKHK